VLAKLIFQKPLLQSSVSHNTSEILQICWFNAHKAFLIIGVENICTFVDFFNFFLFTGFFNE